MASSISVTQGGCPYDELPRTAYWRDAIARAGPEQYLPTRTRDWRIGRQTAIGSAGSCFAQNIAKWLIDGGFNYLLTEPGPAGMPEAERTRQGYGLYPARFGNIYTPLQLLQLFDRAYGAFEPVEEPWPHDQGWVDPFRPFITLRPFPDLDALYEDRRRHLAAVRRLFEVAEVFIFTLGLTETWRSRRDGAVFPVCPGCRRGTYDPLLYEFVNFGAAQTTEHLDGFVARLNNANPRAKIILTVSPVPLIATMEPRDAVQSTVYSKAVLRVAADEIARRHHCVEYFPAYEVVTSNSAAYFAADRRSVTSAGVDHVMRAFAANFVTGGADLPSARPQPRRSATAVAALSAAASTGSSDIAMICDEEMAYEAPDNPCEFFASFPREFYVDGRVVGLMTQDDPLYRSILDRHVPDCHTIIATLSDWLAALARAAAGRQLIVTVGGSHSVWSVGWPYPMARELERLQPGRYIVVNVAMFAYTLLHSARLLQTTQAIFASRGLHIDRVVSLDGYNDLSYRLLRLFQHFVSRQGGPFLPAETEFAAHRWRAAALAEMQDESVVVRPIAPGVDYGSSPPLRFHPLPQWEEDLLNRIRFALDTFRDAAEGNGARALNVLQPIATASNFPSLPRARREEFQRSGEPDFYEWRRRHGSCLDACEWGQVAIRKAVPSGTGAVLELEAPLRVLEAEWEQRAARSPDGFLNLLACWREHETDPELFQSDACHYTEAGADKIGRAIAAMLAGTPVKSPQRGAATIIGNEVPSPD